MTKLLKQTLIKQKIADKMDLTNISMKLFFSHIETTSELIFFLQDKVLQIYSASAKKMIMVCGAEAASNIPDDPISPLH